MSASKANFCLLWVAFIWGSTFTMVKGVLETIGPSSFIAIRFTLATALLALLFPKKMHLPSRTELIAGIVTGITLGLGFIFQTIGLQSTTSGKAGFITGLYIVFVPLLAFPLLKEQVNREQWIGVGVATIGLGLLCLDGNFQMSQGDLWVVVCAIMFALQVIAVSRYAPGADPVYLTTLQLGVVALVAWIPAFIWETPLSPLPLLTWAVIAFTAVFATLLAFLVQMWAQPKTSATAAALIMALEAVFAALVGWLWAGEILSTKELFGCFAMMAGMLLVELQSLRAPKVEAPA